MSNSSEQIKLLNYKLDILLQKQNYFAKEIASLRAEIAAISANENKQTDDNSGVVISDSQQSVAPVDDPVDDSFEQYMAQKKNTHSYSKSIFEIEGNVEKFIGENLINKIGILITVVGVAIGTKYSIEHQLIAPLTRIILGYLLGLLLLGAGIKLKKNYEKYSAVLVSGAMATMYIITYTAYSMYHLIPQSIAFGLMVVFTVFTVFAALNYNKQVIALMGLVGAYAIPFLLSEHSGKVAIMFGYMTIINIGILIVAFNKYWQVLYHSAFGFTWLIYLSWFITSYVPDKHLGIAFVFATLFFALFYMAFLAYKFLKNKQYRRNDVAYLLMNSFVYFSVGYHILYSNESYKNYAGLFALANAVVHFAVSMLLRRQKLADKNLYFLVTGLMLTFLTIAVPIQLSGKWITVLWIGEAAVLYWIGASQKVSFYLKMAYPLIVLATISLIVDWNIDYDQYYDAESTWVRPIVNTDFLNSLLFVAALGLINYASYKFIPENEENITWQRLIRLSLLPLFVFTLYMMFRLEIIRYWDQLIGHSKISNAYKIFKNADLQLFKQIWLVNYSLLFTGLWAWLNIKKIKNERLGIINLVLLTLAVLAFLTLGLFVLSMLRDAYLDRQPQDVFQKGSFYIIIRYVSMVFLIFALYIAHLHKKQAFMSNFMMQKKINNSFEIAITLVVLWVLSSELLQWMAMADNAQNYKLSLSIFWGVFALVIVGVGIKYAKKHLRIAAISLFAFTLFKLFFYDIASLSTISKTVVFVALGVLLLIISFLYNKFKDKIEDEIAG